MEITDEVLNREFLEYKRAIEQEQTIVVETTQDWLDEHLFI